MKAMEELKLDANGINRAAGAIEEVIEAKVPLIVAVASIFLFTTCFGSVTVDEFTFVLMGNQPTYPSPKDTRHSQDAVSLQASWP